MSVIKRDSITMKFFIAPSKYSVKLGRHKLNPKFMQMQIKANESQRTEPK